ncbi:hypothetical protein E1176_09540 [Fulvivirga sp. RKSG066]|uniref:hypothetical protein n=1 Tax=Fulvivirga aurantia TaxID=2529383 RepID=UPI0031B626BB|nr:hypothetical protein [Fulvivirga aurantia]
MYILILLVALPTLDALAQCAMCRATIENNVSNGEIGIGASLNFGILYLFVMPYLLIGFIGYMWYRNSKSNEKKLQIKRNFTR